MTKNDVRIVQGTSRTPFGEGTSVSIGYGGWLDKNFFLVEAQAFEQGQEVGVAIAYATSIGDATGSVPVNGSATWTGVAVAGELIRQEIYQGDATLTADFTASNIDVAFTNFHDTDTGAARSNIMFDDVPMTSDGFASRAHGRIEGKFYGPNHAEAGGIFERGNTIGAFGAKRQ